MGPETVPCLGISISTFACLLELFFSCLVLLVYVLERKTFKPNITFGLKTA